MHLGIINSSVNLNESAVSQSPSTLTGSRIHLYAHTKPKANHPTPGRENLGKTQLPPNSVSITPLGISTAFYCYRDTSNRVLMLWYTWIYFSFFTDSQRYEGEYKDQNKTLKKTKHWNVLSYLSKRQTRHLRRHLHIKNISFRKCFPQCNTKNTHFARVE